MTIELSSEHSATMHPAHQQAADQRRPGMRFRLILADAVTGAGGGVTIMSVKWAKALIDRGQFVQLVICNDRAGGVQVDLSEFKGIECREVTYNSLDKASTIAKQLSGQLQLNDGDILMVTSLHDPVCAFIGSLRRSGHPCLYIQNVISDIPISYTSLLRHLAWCDLVVTVSDKINRSVAQMAREHGRNVRVITCPAGARVDDVYAGREHSAEFRLCFVGRVEPNAKRVFDLVEVMSLLRERDVCVHLTVIGDGDAKSELENSFVRENLADRVSFTGWLPHDRVLDLLSSQHVLLLPSAYEGFAGALCESMAAGVVPIATRISGSEEAIADGHNGFLTEVGDCQAMADCVSKLSRDQCLYQRLSENAWSTAREKYSVAAIINGLLSQVSELHEIAKVDVAALHCGRRWLSLEAWFVPNPVTRRLRQLRRMLRKHLPEIVVHAYRKLR